MKLASFNSLIKFIVIPSLAIIFYIYGELLFQEVKAVPNNPFNPQKKLTTLGMLIGRNGTPEEFGYMTMPLKVFNENSLLPWQKFRLKKWDHFDVVSDEIAFTVSVADLYYGGEIRLGCFDYKTRDYKSFSKSLLPFSVPKLSADSFRFLNESGADVSFTSDDFTINVENLGNKVSDKYFTRTISVTAKAIDLTLQLEMKAPADQESMTAIIPLTDEKQHFFYTIKMPNIQVEGNLKVGNKEYQITSENAGGFIDWGRGVWTYNTYWVFARGQGFLENGKRFSLNFASGYGDAGSSQATEDSFFIDRLLYKLNVVEPKFDDNNLMNPWTFNTLPNEKKDFQECEIIFAPHYQTVKSLNLIIGQSEMRVVYGQYSGWVTDKNNKKYNFEGLNGSVEVFKTKW